jgi:hypothetical protein
MSRAFHSRVSGITTNATPKMAAMTTRPIVARRRSRRPAINPMAASRKAQRRSSGIRWRWESQGFSFVHPMSVV